MRVEADTKTQLLFEQNNMLNSEIAAIDATIVNDRIIMRLNTKKIVALK
jgi:hypothetical protein